MPAREAGIGPTGLDYVNPGSSSESNEIRTRPDGRLKKSDLRPQFCLHCPHCWAATSRRSRRRRFTLLCLIVGSLERRYVELHHRHHGFHHGLHFRGVLVAD
jgi:hypothetical protein